MVAGRADTALMLDTTPRFWRPLLAWCAFVVVSRAWMAVHTFGSSPDDYDALAALNLPEPEIDLITLRE